MAGIFDRPPYGPSRQHGPGGGRPPIDITPHTSGCGPFTSKAFLIFVGVIGILSLIVLSSTDFFADYLWYSSLGLESVLLTSLKTRGILFSSGAILFFAFFGGNIYLARTLLVREQAKYMPRAEVIIWSRGVANAFRIATVLLGLFLGLIISSSWLPVLQFLNAKPFGVTDPIFGLDVSFFVFSLPVFSFIRSWLILTLIFTFIGVGAVYLTYFLSQQIRPTLTPTIKGHLSAIIALFLLVLAWNYRLQAYELLFSQHGAFFGASYTDVNARMWALTALSLIAILSAVLLAINVGRRGVWLPAFGIGLWLITGILLGGIYPALIQKFQVEPSELAKEQPYIQNNITFTRAAFNLDDITEDAFPANESLTLDQLQQNVSTIGNVRLWDYRPLLDTYNQIQSIRLYYEFPDIDVDRYMIDGKYRQVMLSPRELSYSKLSSQAKTWVNQRLQYTHGYGVVMSLTNEVTNEGLPSLIEKDIPPTGSIPVDRPQIYYGEKTDEYVIVKTSAQEFDYPAGDDNVYSQYQGNSGVQLDSPLKRLLFAWYFGDGNIWFTNYLTPESRILYNRDIVDRENKIAPFLTYDGDPYLVVADGKLYWIHDAYTTTSRFPYSTPSNTSGQNYIRNSVKVVTDAYDGSIAFYVWDPSDPLVQSYASIFPGLFKSKDEMPDSLKAHVRYPEDLFSTQAQMYQTYHMQDVTVFYNKEDMWSRPNETITGKPQPIQPYYVIMKLPSEQKEEFVLLLPFTPSNRTNMVAWLAARSDGDNYGKLLAYKFPKEKTIYGPMQIEARIDQDPNISSQLTLWNQKGSSVIRGNLLVFPIEKSLLYIEPVYLQAEQSQLPELKRIVVATGDKVAMEANLSDALAKIFGSPTPAATPTPTPSSGQSAGGQSPGSASDLAKSAQQHYVKALEYQKAGDWAHYGEELKALQSDLDQLVAATANSQ